MEASSNPYQVFIDVLAYRRAGERRLALTGEMITAYAEMNHLLARTKGDRPAPWSACAAELERCISVYRTAWQRFAEEVSAFTEGRSATVSPSLGPETTQAFQEAVDGLQQALDLLRSEARMLGVESWVMLPPGANTSD